MNCKQILLSLTGAMLYALSATAEEADTLKTMNVDEVVVVAAPKENRALRELPIVSDELKQ